MNVSWESARVSRDEGSDRRVHGPGGPDENPDGAGLVAPEEAAQTTSAQKQEGAGHPALKGVARHGSGGWEGRTHTAVTSTDGRK